MNTTDHTMHTTKKSHLATIFAFFAIIFSVAALTASVFLYQAQQVSQNQYQQSLQMIKSQSQSQNQQSNLPLSHLIVQAKLMLNIHHDVKKTIAILQIIEKMSAQNTAFSDLNTAVKTDIAQLQAIPSIDIQAIFAQLSQLSQQIMQLPVIAVPETKTPLLAMPTHDTQWRAYVAQAVQKLKSLVIVREVKSPPALLLDQKAQFLIKQNIMMQLSLAQWALLHHDAPVYAQALKTVSMLLAQYFSLSQETNTLIAQITALQNVSWSESLPSLDNLSVQTES